MNKLITQEYLKTILNYNQETGEFTWISKTSIRIKIGAIAGNLDKGNGYIKICINGKKYYAHRLVWLYLYGNFPQNQIDHKDLDRKNNRISNLREATNQKNGINRNIQSNNKSGVKGVSWDKSRNKWFVQTKLNGKSTSLGRFDALDDAICVRREFEKENHHEFRLGVFNE